jgi:cytochrome c
MNMKANMAMAALVSAGIIAWLSGGVSQLAVNSEELKKDAVTVEVAEVAPVGGTAKPAGADPIMALIATADIERGKAVAKACAACHSFDQGGKNGVGPNLHNVVLGKKDAVAGYAYSGALMENGSDVWTYASLNKFLWKPKAYAPKTKMSYAGLRKPEDRAAIIAYLRSLNNAPLPSQADIDAEPAELEKLSKK